MTTDPGSSQETTLPLRRVPVIVLSEMALLDVVRAGVRRAGGLAAVLTIADASPAALRTVTGGQEVVIARCEAAAVVEVIQAIRVLGGRPIPVISLGGGDAGPAVAPASWSWLSDPSLRDLEIPVPAVDDDDTRKTLWDQLRDVRAEERHHLVEVDGRPALEELASALPGDPWACLAAGAAGVLGGRLAAANRRWRAQLDA